MLVATSVESEVAALDALRGFITEEEHALRLLALLTLAGRHDMLRSLNASRAPLKRSADIFDPYGYNDARTLSSKWSGSGASIVRAQNVVGAEADDTSVLEASAAQLATSSIGVSGSHVVVKGEPSAVSWKLARQPVHAPSRAPSFDMGRDHWEPFYAAVPAGKHAVVFRARGTVYQHGPLDHPPDQAAMEQLFACGQQSNRWLGVQLENVAPGLWRLSPCNTLAMRYFRFTSENPSAPWKRAPRTDLEQRLLSTPVRLPIMHWTPTAEHPAAPWRRPPTRDVQKRLISTPVRELGLLRHTSEDLSHPWVRAPPTDRAPRLFGPVSLVSSIEGTFHHAHFAPHAFVATENVPCVAPPPLSADELPRRKLIATPADGALPSLALLLQQTLLYGGASLSSFAPQRLLVRLDDAVRERCCVVCGAPVSGTCSFLCASEINGSAAMELYRMLVTRPREREQKAPDQPKPKPFCYVPVLVFKQLKRPIFDE